MSRRPQVDRRFDVYGTFNGSDQWMSTHKHYEAAERAKRQWQKKHPGVVFFLRPTSVREAAAPAYPFVTHRVVGQSR